MCLGGFVMFLDLWFRLLGCRFWDLWLGFRAQQL